MKPLFLLLSVVIVTADYWDERQQLLNNEEFQYLGYNIKLTTKEEAVNKLLMDAKNKDLEDGFLHPECFPPAQHFFLAKKNINKSPVFKFIQMPKGGALHVHDTAVGSVDYILKNITYRDHLLACHNEEGLLLVFADPPPEGECWVPLRTLRENASSVEDFDTWLRSKLSLETDKPYEKYPDINSIWKTFQGIFNFHSPMLSYRLVFEDYFYQMLKELYEDNVNYLELRANAPSIYDLNGSYLDPIQGLGLYKEVSDRFMKDHPDFLGIKFIYSTYRQMDNQTLYENLELFKKMKKYYPSFVVGFDLVGQEDLGIPLVDFVDKLLETGPDVKFYFHAGETNWNGMSTDLNLVDALLLNTTRIGHGYALLKHPVVLAEARRRGVAVEVCPVSHQVLGLLNDLRNHPASAMLARDFPVVVSSDDPALWGALPLSHDFYEVFVGVASRQADLRLLKQLALNSLIYSSLEPKDKGDVIVKFHEKWDRFIDDVFTNGL